MATIDTTALEAAYQTEIDNITSDDPIRAAEAAIALTRYAESLTAVGLLDDVTIDSYSISGRSVTRRQAQDMAASVQDRKRELENLLFGSVVLADQGDAYSFPSSGGSYHG